MLFSGILSTEILISGVELASIDFDIYRFQIRQASGLKGEFIRF